jgi:uncharacterized membrane protein YphA (DoxX/SURF4 family)
VSRAHVLDLVGTLARLGLAAVWLVSGALKAIDLDQAVVAVRAYDVLPWAAADVVAAVLPFFEIALGLLLLLGLFTRAAAIAATVLMVVFIIGISQAWARGLTIDCGCFGGGGQIGANQTKYPQEIARDTVFALAGAWLWWRPRTLGSLDHYLFGH